MKKKSALLLLILALSVLTIGCQKNVVPNAESQNNNSNSEITAAENKMPAAQIKYANIEQNPEVTMEIEDMGMIKIELYPQVAPTTVENFISLVSGEFYNGLTFHRVIPGFVAQGGDPEGTGLGGPDYSIKGEFSSNGVENNISHKRGIVSMARSQKPDSAGSQFFIVTDDAAASSLDGNYAAFGKVVEGMDVVDKIVNLDVVRREVDEGLIQIVDGVPYCTDEEEYIKQMTECDRPVNPPVITSATVDTFGVEYDEPTKIVAQ